MKRFVGTDTLTGMQWNVSNPGKWWCFRHDMKLALMGGTFLPRRLHPR